jgi:aryl-alcohol dehydrogenase-like predicted oxidoreductase
MKWTTRRKTREGFLKELTATTALLGAAGSARVSAMSLGAKPLMPRRKLGNTGQSVGIFSLGAQATCEQVGMREEALKIINRAIDLGVNYIDTSAKYGKDGDSNRNNTLHGTSERHVGEVMKTRRKEVFLATKTHDRSYDGSMRLLETSLKNLQTDHIDLWQIHAVGPSGRENIDRIFADDGVLKAMEKALDEKTVSYLGITGHADPATMRELVERYPFDCALMALNAADKHHNSYIEKLLPHAVGRNMGVIGMKIPARDRIFSNGGIITMEEAMRYTLSLPVSTVIVGIDNLAELEENVQIARSFEPFSAAEMLAIEDKVKPHYKHLMFYKGLSSWPQGWSGN